MNGLDCFIEFVLVVIRPIELLVHFVHPALDEANIAGDDAHEEKASCEEDEYRVSVKLLASVHYISGDELTNALIGQAVLALALIVFAAACPVEFAIDIGINEAVRFANSHIAPVGHAIAVSLAALIIQAVLLSRLVSLGTLRTAEVASETVQADALLVFRAALSEVFRF